MSLFKKILFFLLIGFSLFFASWYQLHGDISFTSDIGRDFLILRQVDQKKIILIGPRASGNLFHGPMWPYMEYPFYFLGQGNPVAVGWGWVFYTFIFTVSCYFVAKKLFGKETAYLFSIMAALYTAFSAHMMINPNGAMFFIPAFFYFFIRYFETLKRKFLLANLILGVILIQTELALGIPLVILSSIAILFKQFKTKNFKQVLYFLLIPAGLSNFFIFDLRHGFIITHNVLKFVSPQANGHVFNYAGELWQRIYLAFTGVEVLRVDLFHLDFVLFLGILFMIYIQVKNKKYKTIYLSFLYFYFGYFVLSFIDKGPLLYFYQFPMFPLVFLIFSSFVTSKYKRIFLVIFALVLLLNIKTAFSDMYSSQYIIGKNIYSWKFLNTMTDKVFSGKENTFGYFVYSPDALAYEPKFAMLYKASKSRKDAQYFTKEKITYIVAEPPPPNNQYMHSDWWIKNEARINATPSAVFEFPNGYKILKYQLSDSQIKIPAAQFIDPGLNFR